MKRKYVITAGIMAVMMAVATGCKGGEDTGNQDTILSLENEADDDDRQESQSDREGKYKSQGDDKNSQHNQSDREGDYKSQGDDENSQQGQNNEKANNSDASVIPLGDGSKGEDTIIIGGKVRDISQNSFIISRVLMEDSGDGNGSIVVMPEPGSPDEELVTVRYTDSTTFERWTIKGGGGDIVTNEAFSSDIKEGDGLEASGYFDGDEFVAERVIIEVYE